MRLRFIFSSILALFLCNTGYSDLHEMEKELSRIERQIDHIKEENVAGSFGGKSPTARGCPWGRGPYIILDFLYWRAQTSGFPLAYHDQDTNVNDRIGKIINISYDWDPGLKASLGWNSAFDAWDIIATWTYYHNHSKDSKSVEFGTGFGLESLWLPNQILEIGSVKGSWRLNYNTWDLEVGRAYFVSYALSFRPYFGVRGALFHQDYRVAYDQNTNPNVVPGDFKGDNDFWGVGPRTGIVGDWHLAKGFSFFGNISASVLYGKFDIDMSGVQNDSGNLLIHQVRDDYYELSPTLQIILGFSWGTCFYKENMFLALKAGWETNYWWGQSNLSHFLSHPDMFNNRAVNLEGVTLEAKLDF